MTSSTHSCPARRSEKSRFAASTLSTVTAKHAFVPARRCNTADSMNRVKPSIVSAADETGDIIGHNLRPIVQSGSNTLPTYDTLCTANTSPLGQAPATISINLLMNKVLASHAVLYSLYW